MNWFKVDGNGDLIVIQLLLLPPIFPPFANTYTIDLVDSGGTAT